MPPKQHPTSDSDAVKPEAEVLTIEQAAAKIKALEKMLEDKEEVIAQKDQELKEFSQDQEGYLVVAPNPVYDGSTMGIKFNSGLAFLPASATYPNLGGRTAKPKDGSGKEKVYIPDSKQVAQWLQNDFGYEYKFYSYEEMKALKQQYANRTIERAAAEEAIKAEQEKVLRQDTRFSTAREV